eukprot:5892346-Prymnesium_polylepis.1
MHQTKDTPGAEPSPNPVGPCAVDARIRLQTERSTGPTAGCVTAHWPDRNGDGLHEQGRCGAPVEPW